MVKTSKGKIAGVGKQHAFEAVAGTTDQQCKGCGVKLSQVRSPVCKAAA